MSPLDALRDVMSLLQITEQNVSSFDEKDQKVFRAALELLR